MKGLQYECNNLVEVMDATSNLDVAEIVPLKMDFLGNLKEVNNYRGVYNVTRDKFCAAVVPYYNLVQHKQYFDSFAQALDRLNMKFKMTIKTSGDRAFCDIEFDNKNIKFDKLDEEFITGMRLVNSYDKSTGLHCMPRFTRLACTNGMILTRNENTVSIKHHSKMIKELEKFIENKIHTMINEYSDLQTWVSESIKDSIEWNAACKIIEKLFKQPKHREEILKRLDIDMVIVEDKKSKKKSVTYVWNDENKKKKKFNRWELYNAVTNYLTYGEHITPHIENLFHKRAEKLLVTPLIKMPKATGI